MQARESHGPPWDSAVAASKVVKIGASTLQIDFGPGEFDLSRMRSFTGLKLQDRPWLPTLASSLCLAHACL